MYSSRGSIAGWSTSLSSQDRVEATWSPARCRPLSSSTGESGLRSGASRASRTSASTSSIRARPRAADRPRAEDALEDALVLLGAPRQAGDRHLDGDERADALGGEQQREAARLGARLDRGSLQREFGDRIVVGWRGSRSKRASDAVVPSAGPCASSQRERGERAQLGSGCGGRVAQDRAAQAKVDAPLDPDAGGEQRRVPAGGVVPDPARMAGLLRSRPTRSSRRPAEAARRGPRRRRRARRPARHPGTSSGRRARVQSGGGGCHRSGGLDTPAARATRPAE